jgi:hypothetical protein
VHHTSREFIDFGGSYIPGLPPYATPASHGAEALELATLTPKP